MSDSRLEPAPTTALRSEPFPGEATRRIILPLLAAKLLTLALVACAALVFPAGFSDEGYIGIYFGNHAAPPKQQPSADVVFRTWDAEHYLLLAATGYGGAGPKNAYYPLYPALVRLAAPVFGGDLLSAALVLSTAFGLLALIVLHDLLVRHTSVRVANLTVMLMCLQPAAFFNVLPYSEALFLLLLAVFCAALARERFWWAAALGALMALTRAIGVFSVLPLAAALLTTRRPLRLWTCCCLPILGWAAYFVIVGVQTGNPWLGLVVQKNFATAPSIARLFDPLAFARELFHVRRLHAFSGSLLERISLAAYLAALPALFARARRDPQSRPWFVLSLSFGLVPAIATVLMSFTRYVSVVFPVFVVLAEALAPKSRRLALAAVSLGLLALQLTLLYRHVTFRWAG